MRRPERDETFMDMAQTMAKRTTCVRRAVGCVLVSARGHVLATGYNGVASGRPHCNHTGLLSKVDMSPEAVYPYSCDGAHDASGTNLDGCEAIHAEQNALLQCKDVYEIDTVYVTTAPCVTCAKLFLNTGAKRIVFLEDYLQSEASRKLWEDDNREWLKYEPRKDNCSD